MFLADEATATVWLHNMIKGPAGQTRYGVVEGIDIFGDFANNFLTYENKISLVMGIIGGISSIV
jgi:hypothetical protein